MVVHNLQHPHRLLMEGPPAIPRKSTGALFAIVRSQLGQYIRHTLLHLFLTGPTLKPFAKHLQNGVALNGGELVKLEETIEDLYLKSCAKTTQSTS